MSIHSSLDLDNAPYVTVALYISDFILTLFNYSSIQCCFFLLSQRFYSSNPAWIGLSLGTNSGFGWSDGSPVCSTYLMSHKALLTMILNPGLIMCIFKKIDLV